jgi:probable rRNA maturation factor
MGSAKQQQEDIDVQIFKNYKDLDVSVRRLKRLVKAVCNRFELSRATVSIAIVDSAHIRRVNKQFLKRNTSTDCLSFDLSEDRQGCSKSFELVVNAERSVKEANLRGHSSEAELALYIVHGLLHNLGFDDSARPEAKKMHQMEDEILQEFGYGSVYNRVPLSNKVAEGDRRRLGKQKIRRI